MSKQLNVNLGFTADTSQAAAQIQNLQNQLTGLLNSTNGSMNFGSKVVGDVNKASKAIAELKMHLKNATNVNTGTLDFTKLNESIGKSGTTLQQYGDKLRSLGPAGQQAFNALANSVAQSEIPIRRSNAALTEMWTTLKNTARWQISSSILHGFMGAISSAVGYAKDLNKSLNDIRIVTGASVDQMAQFAEQANRSAKALSASTTEYTKASLIYYQQGLDDQAVKERTDVTIKMANVSGQAAETVSDQMTAVWNNFAKGGEDLERFADVMVRLGADTASSSDEIAQGLEKFAAIGDMVGLSFDNAAAALATVTATTRQSADVVGTAFKTIFARIQGLKLGETLEDGTDLNKYSEALATVGISIKEQNGELKDMDNILAEMGAKWGTLSKDQQVALAQTVAGVRQYNQLVALMDNFDFYEQNLQSAATADGSLQEQADIYAESWQAASDRVKAATQGIYEDLLNDEAFIDVLNIIEKILTYVDNLIDGLGGLGGVLTTVGVLLTRAFSAQIAQGITSMTNGIKMMTAAGREQAQQQKAQFMKDSADAMRDMSDGSNEGNVRATMMEDQLRLQTSMIENSERMSAEEQQINQMLLDRQRILSENAIAAAKELDAATEARSDATFNARVELAQEARGWAGGDLEAQKKNLSDFTKQFNQIQQKLKQGITARVNLEELRKLPVEGEKGKQVIDKIKQAVDKIDDAEIKEIVNSLDSMELNAENVEDAIAALTIRLREMQGASEANMMDENSEWMLSEDAVHGLSAAYEDEATAALRAKDAEEQANEARDNAANSINNATGAQKTWADQMVAGANVVMSLVSVLQAVSGIIDVATNPDMSGWEKFLSIGSSLAMIFVMLAPLLSGTNLQFLAMVSSTVAAKVGLKGASLAALETTAATGALSASLWTLLWPIGLVIAAIAALVGVFTLLSSIAKDNAIASLEGQLEATEEASNNLAENLRKTQEEADNLKTVFDGYNSVVEELRRCEKGTDEWREALEKVNQEVIALLDKYPELAGYMDSSGKAGVYRDEQTGALAVNENFFKDMNQSLENGIENISIGKVLTDQRHAVLSQQSAEEELTSLLFDKSLFSVEDVQNGLVQDLIDSYMGKSDKTFADIFNNNHETVEAFFDLLEDSSTGLSDAFQKVAQASNQATLGLGTTGTTIANLVLGNNQKIQNSEYAERITATSGKQYEDFYKEAVDEINAEAGGAGWGKEGVSKWTKTNKTAEKYFEDYLKAMGKKIEDYELLDTYGKDDARRFKFKKKDAEDSEAETLGLQEMLDIVASERVKEKMEGFGVGLIQAVEQLDNFVSSTTDMSQIQKDTIDATKDFLLDQNFKNTGLVEINAIDDYIGQLYNGDIGAYLGATFGGDNGILDDKEAQELGYDSAQIMIEAFKSSLNEADLSKFSKTIQDIVDKGANVSASIAQRYSEMVDINSTFGTVEGSTEVTSGTSSYAYTEAQSERVRFDHAVQNGLSEEAMKANEELTRMVELLEQAPAGFQNLSEAADKIESGSVAEFNEELQDVIDTFNDYGELDFTDIADGIIDEDEAKDLDINTKSLDKYIDLLEETEEGAGKTRDELMELAEASLKTAKAFSDLKEDWGAYRKNLQSGDIAKQADAIAKVGQALKGVFGFDLSELDISNTFLTDAENIQLVEDAINGVDGALEKLQGKLFTEIFIDAVGEENVQNVINELIAAGVMLEGQSFEAAFTADPSGFLNALAQSENAAKISASAIQAAVSAMGYSMSYETETAETTQVATTDGGYSWETVPGAPFEYEYIKNTEPGEEPVKDSITITPIGLKKVPNDPVEVSTTQLTGGSATNYEFGDGTSTNNSVSMADIKNIKVTKKTDTPTSKSIKGASPLVGSGSNPAGSGSEPKKSGGGSGKQKSTKPKEQKEAKKVEPTEAKKKDEEIERYKETTEVLDDLSRELDEIGAAKDEAWGNDKITQMDKELAKLKQIIKEQKNYINQIGKIDKNGNAIGGKLKIDQDAVRALGATFDEFGRITNYEQIMGQLVDNWNSTQSSLDTREQTYEDKVAEVANTEYTEEQEAEKTAAEKANETEKEAIDDAREKADKDYETGKEAIEQYIETLNLSEEATAQLDEYFRQMRQFNYEKLVYQIELRVELNQNDIDDIEFKLERLGENETAKIAERLVLIEENAANYIEQARAEVWGMQEAERLYNLYLSGDEENGISKESYMKQIQEGKKAIQDLEIGFRNMIKQIGEELINAFDLANEELDKSYAKFDNLITTMEHYKTVIALTGKRGEESYAEFNKILKASQQVIQNRIASEKAEIAMWNEVIAKQKEEIAQLEEGSEERIAAELALENSEEKLQETKEQLMSNIEQLGEYAREIFENSVEQAAIAFEERLLEGQRLSDKMESIDMLNARQEELLTTTNKLYETNKMIYNIEKDIDATTNQRAKQQLINFQNTVKQKQEQTKLSKFELDLLQAQYEIEKAKIALEEAQNSKSTVRLSRDSEGNYGYVYTASQDKVADAEQKLADATNAYYNTAMDGAQKYQEQIYGHIEEWEEKVKEVYLDQTLTEKEKNDKIREINETYNTLITQDKELFYIAKAAMEETAYNKQLDYDLLGIESTKNWEVESKKFIEELDLAQQQYSIDTGIVRQETTDNFGDMETAINNTKIAGNTLQQDMTNKLIPTLKTDLLEAVGNATLAWKGYREELEKIIELSDNAMLKASQDTKVAGSYDYAGSIMEEFAKGADADLAYIDRLAAERQKKLGNVDLTDYQALMNQYADDPNSAEYKTYAFLRSWKLDMMEKTDYTKMLEDYILNEGGSLEDDRAKDILAMRQQKINIKGLTDVQSNESLVESIKEKKQEQEEQKETQTEVEATVTISSIPTEAVDPPKPVPEPEPEPEKTPEPEKKKQSTTNNTSKPTVKNTSKPTTNNTSIPSKLKKDIRLEDIKFTAKVYKFDGNFDTGGYTGSWGPEGKLAMLHEKELVLNKQDTANFLTATEILRDINQMLDRNALAAQLGMIDLKAMTVNSQADQILQQEVTIHADFPNVTDHNEIELAMSNLINAASQYANREF